MKLIAKIISLLVAVCSFHYATAQITWNFTSNSTAAITLPANLTAASGSITSGNTGATVFLPTTAATPASSGYTGFSGGANGNLTAATGAINISTSAYVEMTLTPAAGYAVSITAINWGNYSISTTGPTTYSIRTNKDNYAANINTNTISGTANSSWGTTVLSGTLTATTGLAGSPLIVRIYASGGTGTPVAGTANWRVDDIKITATAVINAASTNSGTVNQISKYITASTLGNSVISESSSGNIGIATTTPAASALLDVSSTTKGLLAPRMTSTQRTAIASPAIGLLVYQTDVTEGLYQFKSVGGWTAIGGGSGGSGTVTSVSTAAANNGVTATWSNASPTPALTIGLGAITPTSIATGSVTATGLTIPTGAGANKVLTSDASGVASWQTAPAATTTAWGLSGNSGTNSTTNFIGTIDAQDLRIKTGGADRIFVQNSTGNVGIGITAPNAKLHVAGDAIVTGGLYMNYANTTQYPNGESWINFHHNREDANGLLFSGISYLNGTGNIHITTNSNVVNSFGGGFYLRSKVWNNGTNKYDYTERLAVNNLGNVGIGTISPAAKLDVAGNIYSNSKIAMASNLISGEGSILFASTNGGLSNYGAFISGEKTGTWGTRMDFYARDEAGVQIKNVMSVSGEQTGGVTIGTTILPNGYKLAVAGNIIAEKVKVKLQSAGWPDYVFEPTYTLKTLPELEKFIQTNRHLPNVPSAIETQKNGIDLGDNQRILLEKIEELTLYIIDQNKKVEKLEIENTKLQNMQQQIDELKALLKKITDTKQ